MEFVDNNNHDAEVAIEPGPETAGARRRAVDEPTERDKAVRHALLVGLRQVPGSAYRIEKTWGEDTGWIFKVEPNNPRAPSISAGAEDGSVNLTVGNSGFERCAIEDLSAIVEAALGTGDIGPAEPSQASGDATGHSLHIGQFRLPLPRNWKSLKAWAPRRVVD